MNQFVKTLIKKYKDPSIIGERSAEEVIHYLKQKFIRILYLIFDYPHKHYTFKHFEV